MLPKGNRLPTSRDKARRYVTSLGDWIMIAYMHASMIAFSFVGRIRRLDIVPLVVKLGIEQM